MRVFDEEVLGFLVSLNSDLERLPPELWLLVVYKEEDVDVEPLCLTLVGTITEAIQGGLAKLKRTTLAASPEQKEAALVRLNERYERHVQDLEGMVSLALYLASENREISNPLGQQPQNPETHEHQAWAKNLSTAVTDQVGGRVTAGRRAACSS